MKLWVQHIKHRAVVNCVSECGGAMGSCWPRWEEILFWFIIIFEHVDVVLMF